MINEMDPGEATRALIRADELQRARDEGMFKVFTQLIIEQAKMLRPRR